MTATTRAVSEPSGAAPEIIDFREQPDRDLLTEFHERCRQAFPPHHMEGLSTWEEDLLGDPGTDGPRRQLLLAVGASGGAERRLLAGHLFEYYPESRCGLLSYIHVAQEHRGRGLGRALFERAVRVLTDAAAVGGGDLRAVFAESLDPAEASAAEAGEAWTRHEILARLGARILKVPYVAPALSPERDRARDLLLMYVPDACPGDEALRRGVLLDFLAEFYQALGVSDPDADPDFGRMKAALDEPYVATVELRREQPAVSLPSVSVALHFVRPRARAPAGASDAGPLDVVRRIVRWGEPEQAEAAGSIADRLPRDPAFRSFERDLVSHAFHDPDPFGSEALREPVDAVVTFPRELRVESEGRTIRLWAAGQEPDGAGRSVRLRALRSRTKFGSGVVIDHLVVTNMGLADAALNEFDLVKIVKLLKDAGDASDVVEEVRFAGPAAEPTSLDAWLKQLPRFPEETELGRETLRAATVLVVTGDDAAWDPLYGLVSRLADETDEVAGEFRTLLGATKPPELVTAQRLKATEGVVCSLLNFGDIDHWELADALEPALGSSDYLLWLQKANLVCLAREERLTTVETIRRDIGASPYLLAPHAVLLHNEEILRDTRQALDTHDGREPPDTSRRGLEALRSLVDENLRRHLLSNVFHYRTEREIFNRGQQDRGLVEQTAALERRLEQLKGQIEAASSRAQARQDRVLAFIFGLLSATAIGDVAVTALADDTRWQLGAYVGSLVVVFIVAVVFVWRAGRH